MIDSSDSTRSAQQANGSPLAQRMRDFHVTDTSNELRAVAATSAPTYNGASMPDQPTDAINPGLVQPEATVSDQPTDATLRASINQHATTSVSATTGQLPTPAPVRAAPAAPTALAAPTPPARPIQPAQLIRRTTPPPPKNPLARMRYFWQKDSAYKVLMLAAGIVVAAGLICASVVGMALLRHPLSFSLATGSPALPASSTGQVNFSPTFAPPGGGQGSRSSSQPPMQNMPSLQQTPVATVQPSPSPTSSLTVQITNIPGQVMNFSRVVVSVNTNEPGVTVTLSITYNAPPYKETAGPRTTNDNGNVNIPWHVFIFGANRLRFTATVTAFAVDSSGQKAQSQTFTVKVINSF